MITNKQIPDEVVEAAARAMWRTTDPSEWEKGMAHVAIAAALNAWPGADIRFAPEALSHQALILPLPPEVTHD